jgi:hypothetical protein
MKGTDYAVSFTELPPVAGRIRKAVRHNNGRIQAAVRHNDGRIRNTVRHNDGRIRESCKA